MATDNKSNSSKSNAKEDVPTTSSGNINSTDKKEVPLQAKDSEWVGIQFCKHLTNNNDDEETELQIADTDEKELPPLLIMFPNLKNINQEYIFEESTTNLTKMLVGQQAKIPIMKIAQKLGPPQKKLDPIEENLETDLSDSSKNVISDCSEPYDIELDEYDLKPKHKKRRKTKSDVRVDQVDSSHFNLLEERRASTQSKQRLSRVFSENVTIKVPSSQESFGDDEREEDHS